MNSVVHKGPLIIDIIISIYDQDASLTVCETEIVHDDPATIKRNYVFRSDMTYLIYRDEAPNDAREGRSAVYIPV